MKFITEIDLRNLYRVEPFVTFTIEPDQRLTPEARQFLMDRNITMIQSGCETKNEHKSEHKAEPIKSENNDLKIENNELKTIDNSFHNRTKNRKTTQFFNKMEYISSLFLVTGEQILHQDVVLAEKVFVLSKAFRDLQDTETNFQCELNLVCDRCSGINDSNFSDNIGKCFKITEFHIQLAKGKEIVALHHLRSALREVEPTLLDAYEEGQLSDSYCEHVIRKVNQIINKLNYLICLCVGGEKCQRLN